MTEEQTAGQTPQAIDLMQFVPKVHFEQIPIRNLVSNQEYQRNLSQHHVQRAAANFDLYQINPVKVSRRNGINYVFNGQHTIEIVALVSGSRETPVWCMVYDDLGYEHEADIFANQMKYEKPLLPYEIFMANIEAGFKEVSLFIILFLLFWMFCFFFFRFSGIVFGDAEHRITVKHVDL